MLPPSRSSMSVFRPLEFSFIYGFHFNFNFNRHHNFFFNFLDHLHVFQ